jgi:predicted dehydrogenase
MKKSIKAGIAGFGFIGKVHAEALRRLGFVDVVAVHDLNEESLQIKAEDMRIPKAYASYQEMLDDDEIDVIHVCTPNSFHYQMSKDALAKGKHVLCEKPLVLRSEDARELARLATESKLANGVHYNLRYYPVVHYIRELVHTGKLGRVLAVNGSYQQDWLLKDTDYSWRLETKNSGISRAVADIGTHWMDMAEFVTGSRISKLCADAATFFPVRKRPLKTAQTFSGGMLKNEDYINVKIDTEDYASVLMHFKNGARGTLTVNQMAAGRKNRLYLEICGTESSVAVDLERPNEVWVGHRDKANELMLKDPGLMGSMVREIISFPGGHQEGYPDTVKQFMYSFYSYICAEEYLKDAVKPEFPTFESGYREAVLCEKIIQSAQDETWLSLE